MQIPSLTTSYLGRVGYDEARGLQRRAVQALREGRGPEQLLLLEHDPVITLGSATGADDLLSSAAELRHVGIAVTSCDRGGGATYHGPGQLVGYPILDLDRRGRDLGRYLRGLEQVLIDSLRECAVAAERIAGLTGVWVGERKIAAIGIRVRRWVTEHGFALNVAPRLADFDHLIACGLPDRSPCSIAQLTEAPSLSAMAATVERHFRRHFARHPEPVLETLP